MDKRIKWTEKLCYEEAKKYSNARAFSKGSSGAYHFALKHNLMETFDWFKNPKIKWTKDLCFNISKKFLYKKDFRESNPDAYAASVKHGWLKEFTWLKNKTDKKHKWTEIDCCNIAKNYNSYLEFKNGNYKAFLISKKYGWIKKFTWLEKYKNVDLTEKIWLVYAYELKDNYAYVGLTRNFAERDKVHKRDKRDLLYKFCKSKNNEIPNPIIKYKNLTAEEASYYEDFLKIEYENSGWTLINKAKTGIGSSSLGGGNKKWTEQSCLELAKTCNSKTEFKNKSGSAYRVARKNNWLKNYAWFIDKNRRKIAQYDLNGEFIQIFNSIAEAAEKTISDKSKFTNIQAVCNRKAKTSYGYIWRYLEDVTDNSGNIIKHLKN